MWPPRLRFVQMSLPPSFPRACRGGGGHTGSQHVCPQGPLPSTRLPDLGFRVNMGKDSLWENPPCGLSRIRLWIPKLKKSAARERPRLHSKGPGGSRQGRVVCSHCWGRVGSAAHPPHCRENAPPPTGLRTIGCRTGSQGDWERVACVLFPGPPEQGTTEWAARHVHGQGGGSGS